ncbi:MAG: hypothetical protein PUK85_03905 [Clostridia bacterium]|nr:hypothetical protein [Clostridia bacterium]
MTRFRMEVGLIIGGILLIFSGAAAQGIEGGIQLCLTVLIPSLFPFLTLSAWLSQQPIRPEPEKKRRGLFGRVFHLPSLCLPLFLLSLMGGYPSGARGLSLLQKRGTLSDSQCALMLCGCVNAGPPFVVTFVGLSLLHSSTAGWILLGSGCLSSCLVFFLAARFFVPTPPPSPPPLPKEEAKPGGLFAAVQQGSRSVLQLCALVVLFSGLLSVCRAGGVWEWVDRLPFSVPGCRNSQVLSLLLEITTGCRSAAEGGCPLPVLAFFLSFGGLCVHLQVFSFFPVFPMRHSVYFLLRAMGALLSGLFCRIWLWLFPLSLPVSSLSPRVAFSASVWPGACLFLFLLLMAAGEVRLPGGRTQ